MFDFLKSKKSLISTCVASCLMTPITVCASTVLMELSNIDTVNNGYSPLQKYGKEFFMSHQGDINTTIFKDININTLDSNVIPIIEFNNKLYLVATDGFNDYQLYEYDDSDSSVKMIKINTNGNSFKVDNSDLLRQNFIVFNNKLYFLATNGSTGYELWEYDGTNAPTLVKDIKPNDNSYDPNNGQNMESSMIVYNNKLYFVASDGTNSNKLWEYDGTNDPSIIPDAIAKNVTTYKPEFVIFNNELYFDATVQGTSNNELWKYDGTSMTQVIDGYSGGDFGVSKITIFNNKMYFFAKGGTALAGDNLQSYYFLYEYDGTSLTNKTKIGNDIIYNSNFVPNQVVIFNNKMYFAFQALDTTTYKHEKGLYEFDGVNMPTLISSNLDKTSFNPYFIKEFNNKLYFDATDGTHGNELWVYDGTNAPTMLKDLAADNTNGIQFNIMGREPIVFKNKLYFEGQNDESGFELFSFDGTDIKLVSDMFKLSEFDKNNNINYLTEFNDNLYFKAKITIDGIQKGSEFIKYDGTNPPSLEKDINIISDTSAISDADYLNGDFYFITSNTSFERGLYKYDIRKDTKTVVTDTSIYTSPSKIRVLNNNIYYLAMRSTDWSNVLLKYNPDTNSTTEITDSTINPSSMSSDGINLYFTSNDDVYEFNIENQELVQIPAKNGPWGMDNFHSVGNKIFFNYFENQGEGDLFYYDRDTKETKLAKAINPNGDSRIEDIVVIKDKLYFTAKDITNYQENRDLMVYDTTSDTLSTLVENNATTAISQHSLVKYDDKLYYSYIVQQPSVNIEFREYNPETNTTKVIQGIESNNSLAQTSYGIEKDGTLFFVSAVGSKKQVFTYNSEDSSIVQDTNLSNIDMWLNTILNLGKPLLVIDTILADDINYSTNVGADPISFDLNESANIVSIDGATVEATIDTNGTKGDAVINNNTVTYTPNSNVSGSDNFVIKLINSNNIKRLLNVTVNGIDTMPTDTNNDNNVSYNNTSNQEIISEKSYVIEALNSLKIGLLDNISLDTITSNISLPTTYSQSSVSWDSNNTSIIANNGTVTRPTVDTTVILVATITKGDYSYDKKFELKVLPTIDDNTSVLLTSNSLRVYDILGENKDSSHIYHNLINPLPSSGIDSSTITWTSNKPQIIDNNGTLVSVPLVDTIVTMTATIVKNSEENNVSFPLIVKASNSTNSLENLLQLNGAITIDMLLGANRSPLSVVNIANFI